jgi:glycosyltransferase involved in cell wall biosynthesis
VAALRILIVTQVYPPEGGGAERHSQRMAQCLAGCGHHVTVLTLCPERSQSGHWMLESSGVGLCMVRRLRAGKPRDLFFALATVCLLITEFRGYDCVHWTLAGLHATLGLPVARMLGLRNIVMFGGSGEPSRLLQGTLGPVFLRMIRRWAKRIVILNPQMLAEIERLRIPRSHAVAFPCEVDSDTYAPANADRRAKLRTEFGFATGQLIILFAGRFVPEKNLPDLLQAFHLLRVNAVLVLLGDGPLMPAVRTQLDHLGLTTRVQLPGFQSSDRLRDYLQAADVFALVSGSEGIPCALIEAMAVGLPSVVTSIPAMMQVVDNGVHGLWCRPGEPKSVAECITIFALDPDKRIVMGRHSRERVMERYAMEVMSKRYDEFFRELCQEPA